jgi:hypothetical protein
MKTILRVVIHQRKVISKGDLMNLVIATRYHADMFEAFLLKVFNEETKNALMVGPDV